MPVFLRGRRSPRSSSPRAATTPTSAASRRARCRRTRRTIDEEGVLLDNVQLVDARRIPRGRAARAAHRRQVSGAQRRAESRRPAGAGRGLPERRRRAGGDDRALRARRSCSAYMQHVQDNAEEAVRRVIDALTDGDFAYAMDNGAAVRVAIRIDAQRARSHHRLHRHQRAAAQQLQRAGVGDARRGAVRVPHAGGRRDPDERRLPEAAADHRARRLDAQPALSGRRGRRQRRDLAGRHGLPVRRARRARRAPGHDEQLHLRRRRAPVLRDHLRRLGRRARTSTAPTPCRPT